ncbi:MAG: hypothetical protein ACOYK8_00415 [Alphaproteobacteria bacterium]
MPPVAASAQPTQSYAIPSIAITAPVVVSEMLPITPMASSSLIEKDENADDAATQKRRMEWELLLQDLQAQQQAELSSIQAQSDEAERLRFLQQQQMFQQIRSVLGELKERTEAIENKLTETKKINTKIDNKIEELSAKVKETDPQALIANSFLEKAQKQLENFEKSRDKTLALMENKQTKLYEKISTHEAKIEALQEKIETATPKEKDRLNQQLERLTQQKLHLESEQQKLAQAQERVKEGKAYLNITALLKESGYSAEQLLESLHHNKNLQAHFAENDLKILNDLLVETDDTHRSKHRMVLETSSEYVDHLKNEEHYTERKNNIERTSEHNKAHLFQLSEIGKDIKSALSHVTKLFPFKIPSASDFSNRNTHQMQQDLQHLENQVQTMDQQSKKLMDLDTQTIDNIIDNGPVQENKKNITMPAPQASKPAATAPR